LATDSRPDYVDEALFDDDAIVATTRDARSVGEMLFDFDYLARQLLMDVDGDDAAQLLRSWPEIVAAAADVWSVLPVRRIPVPGEPGRHMDRLAGLAEGIETSLRTGWPGAGATDPRMTQIADTLTRAARLVERYAGEIPLERPDVRDDIAAARTRIMHGLYLTTHAVSVALHQHGRDRYFDAREAGRRIPLSAVQTPYAVAPTAQWIQRIAVCEKAAGAYLHGRFTQALTGEAPRPLEDPGRLQRALTTWDIQAHRTLASTPTPGNILLVNRTQALIAGAGMVLLDAAARADLPCSPTTTERLLPAIDAAGRAWSNLASRWSDLTSPGTRVDGNLARAAAEVRAAGRELTHDKTTMTSLDDIATQPALAAAATAVLHALDAGSELAYIVSEQADRPDLTGPARALSIRAHNDVEAGDVSPRHPADDIVWVSPTDILAKRNVPLPPPVVESLRRASAAVIEAATTLSCAAPAALGSTTTGTHVRPSETPRVGDQTPKREQMELRHCAPPAHRAGHTATHDR
jgi:hypothetical protein